MKKLLTTLIVLTIAFVAEAQDTLFIASFSSVISSTEEGSFRSQQTYDAGTDLLAIGAGYVIYDATTYTSGVPYLRDALHADLLLSSTPASPTLDTGTKIFRSEKGITLLPGTSLESGASIDLMIDTTPSARSTLPEKEELTPGLKVFPNTFSDHFIIETETELTPEAVEQIYVHNLQGKLIKLTNTKRSGHQVAIRFAQFEPAGIYLITLKYKDSILHHKIIKK